jgi:hypothetical protein
MTVKNKMNIDEALVHIQQKLKSPKSKKNAFGNYKYRNLEQILEGLKPLLAETGCSVICSDEIECLGDRYYIKSTVLLKKGSDTIVNTAWAREPLSRKGMDESQITGSSSSYARKYAMAGLFSIDNSVPDADALNNYYFPSETERRVYDKLVNNIAFAGAGKKSMWHKRWKECASSTDADRCINDMEKAINNNITKASEEGTLKQ